MEDESEIWSVVALAVAKKEARQILNAVQYEHAVEVAKRLVQWPRRDIELQDLRIEQIRAIYELKDKGGPLGKINLRVYFGVSLERREVVLSCLSVNWSCRRLSLASVEGRFV